MLGIPPVPDFTRGDQPPPVPVSETVRDTSPVPQTATTNPSETNAAKLAAKGGRTFTSGVVWIARLNKLQEVAEDEESAAGKLLARLT